MFSIERIITTKAIHKGVQRCQVHKIKSSFLTENKTRLYFILSMYGSKSSINSELMEDGFVSPFDAVIQTGS